jgi:anti-sigma-K factor RskA
MSEAQDALRRQLEANRATFEAAGATEDVAAIDERLANLDAEFEEAEVEVEVTPSTEPDVGTGRYEDRTMAQLRALAESKGLAYSGLNKDDLIAVIRGA